MLTAVIVDANALSRGLMNTVLTEGRYKVVGATPSAPLGYLMVQKFRPHVLCIALEQAEDGNDIVEQVRANYPKTLIFMMSGALDAPTLQKAMARGVSGFIVKPFNADKVLRTIRATVIALVKKQQG